MRTRRSVITETSILWRRLDTPGHDACRLEIHDDGWWIAGTAVFLEERGPARLTYHIACDRAWRTQQGEVCGWLGTQSLKFSIVMTCEGVSTLNGLAVPGLANCMDLVFGFTPATNLLQLRRMALAEGQAADVPVAWLDASTGTLQDLPQRYERRAVTEYWNEAPTFDYAALLEVSPTGFILRYPGLWEAEH